MFVKVMALLLFTVPAAAGSICGQHPRAWDTEHALITESELTIEKYEKALVDIEAAKHPSGNPDEMEMIATGSRRLVEGYKLKQEYERHPTSTAKEKFCNWMATDAYWPE